MAQEHINYRETKTVPLWRADTSTEQIEYVEKVYADAPLNTWLPAQIVGSFAYFKTKQEAKEALIKYLGSELIRIEKRISELASE